MPTPGKEYEELIAQVLATISATQPDVTVESDVLLAGLDGDRQIDVVMRGSVGPFTLTTIVECKDFKRRIDVTRIDALHSVMQDVRANKAVLISRKGFSNTAVKKARRLGISLLLADRLGQIAEAPQAIPAHVREIWPVELHLTASFESEVDGRFIDPRTLSTINDIEVAELFQTELVDDEELLQRLGGGTHDWTPTSIEMPYFIRSTDGDQIELSGFGLRYTLRERHFFGHLKDLDRAIYLHDVIEDDKTVIFPAEAIGIEYERSFVEVASFEDLPVQPSLTVSVVRQPNFDSSELHVRRSGHDPA